MGHTGSNKRPLQLSGGMAAEKGLVSFHIMCIMDKATRGEKKMLQLYYNTHAVLEAWLPVAVDAPSNQAIQFNAYVMEPKVHVPEDTLCINRAYHSCMQQCLVVYVKG